MFHFQSHKKCEISLLPKLVTQNMQTNDRPTDKQQRLIDRMALFAKISEELKILIPIWSSLALKCIWPTSVVMLWRMVAFPIFLRWRLDFHAVQNPACILTVIVSLSICKQMISKLGMLANLYVCLWKYIGWTSYVFTLFHFIKRGCVGLRNKYNLYICH